MQGNPISGEAEFAPPCTFLRVGRRFDVWSSRRRSRISGGTPSRSSARAPRTCTRSTANGSRSRGPRPARRSTSSRTACWRSGSRRATRSALLARTSLEWALFDFALALVGAVGAPIYASSSRHDVLYLLENSGAVGVLVEDEEQRAKVEGSGVEHVLSFADLDGLARARPCLRRRAPGELDARAASIDEDDLFTFIYTSGTTGPPKGCMIRHRNYYAMVQKGDELEERLTQAGRRDAAVPAARAQLRAAAPSVGGVHRLHDRLPRRPHSHCRRAATRAADDLPERASGLREDLRRRRRPARERLGRQARDRALGARRSATASRGSARPGSRSRRCSRPSTGSPTASSTRR